MPRIAHLSSAHPRDDTRIFVKQCRTLAAHGHAVTLVVADGLGDALRDQVRILDVGRQSGRGRRMLVSTTRVLDKAIALDADIYHLHDPELIPAGLRLKHLGKKVIFDAHEDLPVQLLAKPYLWPPVRRLLAHACGLAERLALARFDGIIAATPFIRDKFLRIHPRCVDINNYPLPAEFDGAAAWDDKPAEACYVGNIAAIRGIRELVRACALLRTPARLALGGRFAEPALEREVRAYPGWSRVRALGQLDRAGVRGVLARARAGLVTLHPLRNYRDALPVKMFEYMAAGIPVIASDIPQWRAIVDANGCGLCVDPYDPRAIAAAIDTLVQQPALARQMGERGQRAIALHYNWSNEAAKLVDFYAQL